MKILNLVDIDKSDIKYQHQKFPDGQQNIIILGFKPMPNMRPCLDLIGDSIQIKSRLNNWLDLELITCAVQSLRELGITEIHLYVPYIIGARSDRKFEEGGNNYVKHVIAPAINNLKLKSVTCIDPHSDVLEACINRFRKESNLELVKWATREMFGVIAEKGPRSQYPCILVSPDAGASKKIYKLAEQTGYKGDIITCSKDRDKDGKLAKTVIPMNKIHDTYKDIIIIDDICDGGATFINIAKEIKDKYFKNKIYLIVTHSIFSKGTDDLLNYFDKIYTTNSYKDHNTDKIKVLNIF